MEVPKNNRMLEIFFRALHGEHITIKKLSEEYGVSGKSIQRDIGDIQAFLSEHRDLLQNAELTYSYKERSYVLNNDAFLKNKELFAVVKVLLGSRCFSKDELLTLISKLKEFTTTEERSLLNSIISKEVYHYHEVNTDCGSVIDMLWRLIHAIEQRRVLTIRYTKMDRSEVVRKILPSSVMFSEYYFYLIAYDAGAEKPRAKYFRVDRITGITENREVFSLDDALDFDEGNLRERNQFMFPGKPIRIRFSFCGPSVQAVLDRLPTAQIIEKTDNTYLLEAEVNDGRGLMMYLLSQGSWVKVLSPQELVDEMRTEIEKMQSFYCPTL